MNFSAIVREVEKFRKFRSFLKNLNDDYPLVDFGAIHRQEGVDAQQEYEECAICKEHMVQARKLPCGHCFHQFCIMQLIESGSKTCPICRNEFHNPSRVNGNNNGQ